MCYLIFAVTLKDVVAIYHYMYNLALHVHMITCAGIYKLQTMLSSWLIITCLH